MNAQQRDLFTADQAEESMSIQAVGWQTELNAAMDWIRARGRLPKDNTRAKCEEGRAECKVAVTLRRARASRSEEVKEELATPREGNRRA